MSIFDTPLFLRRILIADAAISGTTGLLMAFGAVALGELLGVPATLLRYAGWSLVPFAILVASVSRHEAPPRADVLKIIGLNAAWVAASVLLPLTGWIHPNGLGYAFILGQASAVAVLAKMQYAGLRNSSALAA